jgi:hypothetical protein
MPYDDRKKIMSTIEGLREGRKLIALCNFDRTSEPSLPGLNIQFQVDLKECLYGVLKNSPATNGLDILIYTRGGDANAVWPMVSLIREFDPDFEVLVPFRAHSAGTLFCLAAKKIIMTRLAELSPIDPSTGNQFNPPDNLKPGNRLGISVEDVNAYKDFIKETFNLKDLKGLSSDDKALLQPYIQRLTTEVHPLALGNVQRVYKLILRLAQKLLKSHAAAGKEISKIIEKLTIEPYSHLHMLNRNEAAEILGDDHVVCADKIGLEDPLDDLLRQYEDDFSLRSPLYISRLMDENTPKMDFRFAGGVVESVERGYLFETKGIIRQFSELPKNVTVQLPPGQPMPLVPGLPRKYNIEILEQRWRHNVKQEGITT